MSIDRLRIGSGRWKNRVADGPIFPIGGNPRGIYNKGLMFASDVEAVGDGFEAESSLAAWIKR